MPTLFGTGSGLDTFMCDCCGKAFPFVAKHEHHKIKRASGGKDTRENIALLDSYCHDALHRIEHALRNDQKRLLIPDLLLKLYPDNARARENCLYLATTAALATDKQNPTNVPIQDTPDYSMFDSDDMVHLTPPRVHVKVRDMVNRVCNEMRNPKTGKKMGVSAYLKLLVEQDLRKRGFNIG